MRHIENSLQGNKGKWSKNCNEDYDNERKIFNEINDKRYGVQRITTIC